MVRGWGDAHGVVRPQFGDCVPSQLRLAVQDEFLREFLLHRRWSLFHVCCLVCARTDGCGVSALLRTTGTALPDSAFAQKRSSATELMSTSDGGWFTFTLRVELVSVKPR